MKRRWEIPIGFQFARAARVTAPSELNLGWNRADYAPLTQSRGRFHISNAPEPSTQGHCFRDIIRFQWVQGDPDLLESDPAPKQAADPARQDPARQADRSAA